MKKLVSSILLLTLFSSLLLADKGNNYVDISSIDEFKHLAKEATLLQDTDSKLTFKEALIQIKQGKSCIIPEVDVPYLGFTKSTYWMSINVENKSDADILYYIEVARPLTNLITIYILGKDGELLKKQLAGDDFPFASRPYLHRKFIFPLKFKANSQRTILIETKSDGEILKLPAKLWSINSFTQFVSSENFFLGLFYGFLLLVFILFTFFAIILKESIYAIFIGYILFLGLFQFALDGFAYQFLWPNYPWFGNHAILIFAALSMLFILTYSQTILGFQKLNKRYFGIYKVFYALVGIELIASFTSGKVYELTFPILNTLQVLMSFYFFIGIYLKYKRGNKTSWPLTLAFAFLWFGAIIFVLANVNFIENEFLAANTLKIATAIEVTFLSIAMAGRYREIQKDKIKAQAEAYKRLEEINELKNLQTEKLELQVQERTQEIQQKNEILTTQNKDIINSISYAKRLQDAILPSKTLIEASLKNSDVLYLPKDIVSGDFYWVEATKDSVFFAVADCTGHGVPGALVSVVGYNCLNRCINEMQLKDPGKILDKLTELVEETFSKNDSEYVNDGMDISLCSWDYKNGLKYAGAFNPLYLIRNGEIIELKGDKQPIGRYIKRDPFNTHEILLEPNDSVYLFSDGYADQFGGEKGKKLKYAVFKEYLKEVNSLPTSKVSKSLNKRFQDWKGKESQIDDVCIMNVRF